jgi:acyl-coenzyme A thioesterase PaaI-like protein
MESPSITPQIDGSTLPQASHPGPTLHAWQRASRTAFGRWLFAREIGRRAPYFRTISPRVLELRPGLCRVAMDNRRRVQNHIRTVHALAMGNLVELAAGLATEVTIPVTMRWIPRGMTIEYLRRAESSLIATAHLGTADWQSPQDVGVPVSVHDAGGTEVVRAVVTMHVTPRRHAAAE